MCGIVGILGASGRNTGSLRANVESMAGALRHRGPDAGDVWTDASNAIALGHRRLAVLDLTDAGRQPMVSASSRFVLAWNGEIYNHLELRDEMRRAGIAPVWRGHSDTETLLAAFECWGIEDALRKTVGMFAIAVWDVGSRALHLARDRFGEKPLYYGWSQGAFLFGSELKALRTYPGFSNPLCGQALTEYLRFLYVPAPLSVYEGVFKLEPGCMLSITGAPSAAAPEAPLRPESSDGNLRMHRWWSLGAALEGQSRIESESAALEELEHHLLRAVRLQAVSDVPLGAFLSGGVDSSAIVAFMQRQSSRPVKTFTVGFEQAAFDESPHARAVARHLGTEHHELMVSEAEARSVIPSLPTMYDEPFADSSQIPTHLICRAAREHVTVALSGDAGDEVFGGYNRYLWGPRLWHRVQWIPSRVRRTLGAGMRSVPVAAYDAWGSSAHTGRGRLGVNNLGHKVHKFADAMHHSRSLDTFYLSLVSAWMEPEALIARPNTGTHGGAILPSGPSSIAERMMWQDMHTYLPDDILCKVDRAAMATSLETRVPFLDHRIVEHAWRMPSSLRIRDGQGKWALRELLYRHVPRDLIDRPKAGFALPLGDWLRGPLRPWAEELLRPERIQQHGVLRAAPIQHAWKQHLSGAVEHSARLWGILMLQAWLEDGDSR